MRFTSQCAYPKTITPLGVRLLGQLVPLRTIARLLHNRTRKNFLPRMSYSVFRVEFIVYCNKVKVQEDNMFCIVEMPSFCTAAWRTCAYMCMRGKAVSLKL